MKTTETITCDVIGDLLPLYAEELASEDSQHLVESHLTHCPTCRSALNSLGGALPLPEETLPLGHVQRTLKKRRFLTALLAASLVLTLALSVFARLTDFVYVPYSDDLFTISDEVEEDGSRFCYLNSDIATGFTMELVRSERDDGPLDEFLMLWYTPWDRLTGRQMRAFGLESGVEHLYFTYPGNDTPNTILVWDKENGRDALWDKTSMGVEVLGRGVLTAYLFLAVLAAAALWVLTLLLRHTRLALPCQRLALLPTAYVLAHLCAKGSVNMSFAAARDFIFILPTAAVIYAALCSALALRRTTHN